MGAPPTNQRIMSLLTTIGGPISPKSVHASDAGPVFAQNMMYRHSMTVYNSARTLVTTIPDTVNLGALGVPGGATMDGSLVEAAFTPDTRYVYVSNYSVYGPSQGPEGSDTCTPPSALAAGDTPSYVYRVDSKTPAVDQAIQVGMVANTWPSLPAASACWSPTGGPSTSGSSTWPPSRWWPPCC